MDRISAFRLQAGVAAVERIAVCRVVTSTSAVEMAVCVPCRARLEGILSFSSLVFCLLEAPPPYRSLLPQNFFPVGHCQHDLAH